MSLFETKDISTYFEGDFYFHFNKGYYVFKGLGYEGLKDNISLTFSFLSNLKIELLIENTLTNEITTQEISLANLDKNYISFDLDYLLTQNFNITLQLYNLDNKILEKQFILNDLISNFETQFSDTFTNDSRIIFIINDFISKEIHLDRTFCLNCTHEDLLNIYNRYNITKFYCLHKMLRLLNFKYIDYTIYKSFLTNKTFKEHDLITYKADYNVNELYQFSYDVIEKTEKDTVVQFFYQIKKFLNNVNFDGTIHDIENIDNNKRRIILYIQELPKLQAKNYFNLLFQQNLNEIV